MFCGLKFYSHTQAEKCFKFAIFRAIDDAYDVWLMTYTLFYTIKIYFIYLSIYLLLFFNDNKKQIQSCVLLKIAMLENTA